MPLFLSPTDILAGIESEIETVLVLSGVTKLEDLASFAYRPNYVGLFRNLSPLMLCGRADTSRHRLGSRTDGHFDGQHGSRAFHNSSVNSTISAAVASLPVRKRRSQCTSEERCCCPGQRGADYPRGRAFVAGKVQHYHSSGTPRRISGALRIRLILLFAMPCRGIQHSRNTIHKGGSLTTSANQFSLSAPERTIRIRKGSCAGSVVGPSLRAPSQPPGRSS